MTKLIVASDSHGSSMALQRVLDKEQDARALFFLGDGLRDLEPACAPFPGLWVYAVAGNCDLGALEPAEAVTSFDGVNLLYTHGHLYGVKSGEERLWYAARSRGVQLALFGHTHIPFCEESEGVTLFNPGSVGRPWRGEATYGVILLDQGKIVECRHEKVPALWE